MVSQLHTIAPRCLAVADSNFIHFMDASSHEIVHRLELEESMWSGLCIHEDDKMSYEKKKSGSIVVSSTSSHIVEVFD